MLPTFQMLLFVLSLLELAESCKYLAISPNHTMCRYPEGKLGCKITHHGVTSAERDVIVATHNSIRQLIASGKAKKNQPAASNMEKMEWDEELATIAQTLANQCTGKNDCSKCREVDRFPVGQNIFRRKRSFHQNATKPKETDWEKTVFAWYDTVENFATSAIQSYSYNFATTTYTQLAWAETSRVGCGYSHYVEEKLEILLYVCNYGPSGNILEDPIYKTGKACSACPENFSCSKKYPGLCENDGHKNASGTKENV